VRCKTCHYSLLSLPGPPHRCPECGREFDPGDPSTWEIEALANGRRLTWVMLVLLIVMALFLIAAFIPVIQNYLM
jgi:hypothetical protein